MMHCMLRRAPRDLRRVSSDFSRDYVAREMDDVYVYDEMYASTFPSTAILPHALSTIHPSRIPHAQTYDCDHIWVLRCS